LAKGGKGKGRPPKKRRKKGLIKEIFLIRRVLKTLNPRNPKNPVSKLQELNLAQTYSYVHFILGSNKHEVKAKLE
jgi:hypothetical protein